MKLGLLTDIHEQVDHLRTALNRFWTEKVDQVVVIGDLCETGERIEETCRLLAEAKAISVWGNHDFGLCFQPDNEVRAKYPPAVIDFMTSLRPRLVVDGCHFTHVEPWLNPEIVADLWYFEGPPDDHGKLDRIFNADFRGPLWTDIFFARPLICTGFFRVPGRFCQSVLVDCHHFKLLGVFEKAVREVAFPLFSRGIRAIRLLGRRRLG